MIDLKPRKEFAITLESGQVISGKFGTWALKRFCAKRNYTLAQMSDAVANFSIDDLVEFILAAVEQSFRELKTKEAFPYNDIDVCAWIDELGGIGSEGVGKIIAHSSDATSEKKNMEAAA